MKKLLSLLMLLPFGVCAQETKPDSSAPKPLKWEVGLNNTLAFGTDCGRTFYDDMFPVGRNSISAYRNFRGAQIGVVVEGGLLGVGSGWWLSPQAVVNYKVPFCKLYAYGGGVAGYVTEQTSDGLNPSGMNGFVTGVQAGAVYNVSKRFGINLEGGVRFKHMSGAVTMINGNVTGGGTVTTTEVLSYTDKYFPVSVGMRYKF